MVPSESSSQSNRTPWKVNNQILGHFLIELRIRC
ncbi:hypothetical protein PITC_068200 [Penicillium italicum]|uniref:Uncharacterized protein n=1 Tax=Penicillium italicum TaxID=40296 RepID=A0A0A2LE21_PENIT|nr:hypothetical protein PITC_068200 [Penicillium italicum]